MKKIVFLTGTRADFGKIKSLINRCSCDPEIEVHIFVTGMHMLSKYGSTYIEVEKNGQGELYKFINQNHQDEMDQVLAKTILGFSDFVREVSPDLIIVHGDRLEALACSIVGTMNNILVAHVEGGELSGTVDEVIRHSVSKLAHLHFVSNVGAKNLLLQLGENPKSIFVIGSPDLDIMTSPELPELGKVKERYDISYDSYSILMFHPVTTEVHKLEKQLKELTAALIASKKNFVVIYPNNDKGSDLIFDAYERFGELNNFKLLSSMRFEYFLTLMKHADFIIGNSSAGIREAPFYGTPSINLGSRQNNRSQNSQIIHVSNIEEVSILEAIQNAYALSVEPSHEFGSGNSSTEFYKILKSDSFWQTPIQKVFNLTSLSKSN